MKIFDLVTGVTIAVLSYILGPYWQLFLFYLLFNVADYLTRWIAARITRTESSSKAETGIYKKVSLWVLIGVSFGTSYVLGVVVNDVFGANINFTYIGWVVLGMLMINEIRSIIENLLDAGVKVPAILSKGLDISEKILESEDVKE